MRVWWLTLSHNVFDIVIISIGLAVTTYILYLTCYFLFLCTHLRDEEIAMLQIASNWDFGYYSPTIVLVPVITAAPIETAGYIPPAERERQYQSMAAELPKPLHVTPPQSAQVPIILQSSEEGQPALPASAPARSQQSMV